MQYLLHFPALNISINLVSQKLPNIQIQAPFHHLIYGIYLSDTPKGPFLALSYFFHVYILGQEDTRFLSLASAEGRFVLSYGSVYLATIILKWI